MWAPDSRSLYFDTTLGTHALLLRVSVPDGRIERWVDLAAVKRGGFFSPWLGVSPEGDPIFLAHRSVREIYRLALEP